MLPEENRLTKKNDFENVYQNGRSIATPLFYLKVFERHDKKPVRVGIVISKKISTKAHERNRVKRIIKEVVRKNLNRMKVDCDIVIAARPGILHALELKDKLEAELIKVIK